MNHIRILVCRVDDEAPDRLTELAGFDLPEPNPATLGTACALDVREACTLEIGHAVLRVALQAQWTARDAQLVAAQCRRFPPDRLRRDGPQPITVASRLGALLLPRQVLVDRESGARVRPSDAALPAHGGIVTTRAVQEWRCLLAQDLPFASAARLLAWQTQAEQIRSPTTVRTLVRRHGALVRTAEREAREGLARAAAGSCAPVSLVP
jgi:hypothetical protein